MNATDTDPPPDAVPPGDETDSTDSPASEGADAETATTPSNQSANERERHARQVRLIAALVGVGGVILMAIATFVTLQPEDDHEWSGVQLGAPVERPDFTLTDTEGEPFNFRAETQGELTLLFFGYTNCPDICPIHMATLGQVLDRSDMPQPNVVFVTTDPERDTPQRLRTWLDQFDADFIGLTGTLEEIQAAETTVSDAGIPASVRLNEESGLEDATSGDDYEVNHGAAVMAFTSDDQSHIVYPSGTRQEDWVNDLPALADGWPEDADDASGDSSAAAGATGSGSAAAGSGAGGDAGVTVQDAWVSASLDVGAAYVTLENTGEDDVLVGASSDVAQDVSVMGEGGENPGSHDGAETTVEVPPGVTEITPGVAHIMLEGLEEELEPGDTVSIELELEHAGTIPVEAEVLEWSEVVDRVEGSDQ